MRRRVTITVLWLLATAAAVAISFGGVQLVAARVTEPVRPPLPGTAIAAASELGTAPGTPTGTPPDAAGTPVPDASAPSTRPPGQTPTGPSTPTPRSEPPRTSGSPPAAETRTYELVGGTVQVSFAPGDVRVVWATPRPGFSVEQDRHGAGDIEVEFESDDHRSRLRARWDGAPTEEIREDADGEGGDDDSSGGGGGSSGSGGGDDDGGNSGPGGGGD